jgi:hypothetical protein
MVQHLSAEEIIQYISDAKKSTPLKVYVNGNFDGVTFPDSFKVDYFRIVGTKYFKRIREGNTIKITINIYF